MMDLRRMNMENALCYRRFDHTADMGIEVTGDTREALFENAALSLGDLIAGWKTDAPGVRERWSIPGRDLPDLMVNWLREILYLWTGEGRLIREVGVHGLMENRIDAEVVFSPFDPKIHEIRHEIKAVTYHRLTVAHEKGRWVAVVVFDL